MYSVAATMVNHDDKHDNHNSNSPHCLVYTLHNNIPTFMHFDLLLPTATTNAID